MSLKDMGRKITDNKNLLAAEDSKIIEELSQYKEVVVGDLKELKTEIIKHVEEDVKKPYKRLIDKHHLSCEDHFYICQTKFNDNDSIMEGKFKK